MSEGDGDRNRGRDSQGLTERETAIERTTAKVRDIDHQETMTRRQKKL